MPRTTFFAPLLAAMLFPMVAPAEPADEASDKVETVDGPAVLHVPVTSAEGEHSVEFYASLRKDWEFDEVLLEYRRLDRPADDFESVLFERASSSDFVAIVPASQVQPPGIEYFIRSRSAQGEQLHYASAADPRQVVVLGDTAYTRQLHRLQRHDGHRSEFALYGEFTRFGQRAFQTEGDRATSETLPGTDWFWGSTLDYTYRFLSTLYAINFGVGVLRGHLDTVDVDGDMRRADPNISLGPADEPGMNYGWGQLTVEMHEIFSVDMRLLLGASAVGFAAGVGGTMRIGEIGRTRLELGGEAFQDIGNVGSMFFHWDTIPRVPMALGIELTSRPNPTGAQGSRVIYDIGLDITDSIGVTARVGNVIRTAGTGGGWMGGLRTSYAF